MLGTRLALYGIGTDWCTSAKDGGTSYLRPRAVSISKFTARTELLSGRIWVAGRPYLSPLTTASITTRGMTMAMRPLPLPAKIATMPLLRSSILIVYAVSGLL